MIKKEIHTFDFSKPRRSISHRTDPFWNIIWYAFKQTQVNHFQHMEKNKNDNKRLNLGLNLSYA
jgi:hypothetical protein